MSADTVTNPPPAESNTARKKRAKAEAALAESTPAASTPTEEQAEPSTNGALSQHDSPYVKELQKQIRNVTKKLNSTAKLDAILEQHKDVSLDNLVAQGKINKDQREQALRKPGLQANLTQLEEQIALYKRIDEDYQSRMNTDRESLTSSHKTELESLRAQLEQDAAEKSKAERRKNLLTFSQFLRAAAAKRANVDEAETEESRAFEGVLLLVYGGDDAAVDAAEKLIEGSDDAVPSVEGTLLSVKYSQVKSEASACGGFPEEDASAAEATSEQQPTSTQTEDPASDPTIAHAGLTELGDNSQTNGLPVISQSGDNTIPSASTDAAHSNAAGEEQWDNNTTAGGASAPAEENLSESFEMILRNPSETEAVHEPAQPQSTNSWADDATAAAAETSTPAAPAVPATTEDGGFQQVQGRGPRGGSQRGHGEGRGRGGHRSRGGFRGDGSGRGRGRGGFRGEGRGGQRGGPRGQSNAADGVPAPVRS